MGSLHTDCPPPALQDFPRLGKASQSHLSSGRPPTRPKDTKSVPVFFFWPLYTNIPAKAEERGQQALWDVPTPCQGTGGFAAKLRQGSQGLRRGGSCSLSSMQGSAGPRVRIPRRGIALCAPDHTKQGGSQWWDTRRLAHSRSLLLQSSSRPTSWAGRAGGTRVQRETQDLTGHLVPSPAKEAGNGIPWTGSCWWGGWARLTANS